MKATLLLSMLAIGLISVTHVLPYQAPVFVRLVGLWGFNEAA